MEYPMQRNLDGVYFRVKRDDNFLNICFSDLTKEERDKVMKNRDIEWIKSLCNIIADELHAIGDALNLTIEEEGEEKE